ncbi:hypothetical protein G9A89_021978 [Geosiphon pyriformis]|nr:hypothetical protein G9A89_021978 [Geosiphon pyriformis]
MCSCANYYSLIAKTQVIRKIFSLVNGFGGVTTSSKFEGIIRLTFTSEKSLEMAASLAREKKIDINSDLKRQRIRSDQAVVIKKIPINTLKDIIVAIVSEFEEIKSIKIQLIEMWQKAVVKFAELDQANLDHETWTSRNQFKVLLFTLLVGTTAHNLRTLLERAGEKTCVINRFLETGNRICCAVVGFKFDDNLEFAFHIEPILGSVKLSWAKMDLVQYEKCRKFGHSALECDAPVASFSKSSKTFKKVTSDGCRFQLAKLYEKKSVPISHSAAFGGKSWAQVVSLAGSSDGFYFTAGSGFPLSGFSGLNDSPPPVLSLELLTDQVSGLVCKLSNMELVPQALSSSFKALATVVVAKKDLALDIIVDSSELVL